MKRIFALCSGLAMVAVALPAGAQSAFTDTTCTEATAPVRAYTDKTRDQTTTIPMAVLAAQKVVDAYDLCASEKLSRGEIENLQYAHLSQARYDYVIGGWQHLDGNDDLARTALQAALKLAQDIIDWHPASQNYYQSNDVNVGSGSSHNAYANGVSKYREDAIQVRDAALKSIGLLAKPGSPPAVPGPAHT